MQIIYISNRLNEMADTIKHVQKYMQFISDIVIFCPSQMISNFKSQLPDIKILDENELLSNEKSKFDALKNNHQANHDIINYLLRKGLALHPDVADEFIMSDDDYRPIKNIDLGFYKNNYGQYNAYFMTSIEHYIGFISQKNDDNVRNVPFHKVHHDMLRLFKSVGLPSLMYAAHMPQIINKRILRESAEYFSQYSDEFRIDEWSTYFNFAIVKYPNRFNNKLYETMCWPHLDFALAVPDDYAFELIYQDDTIKSPYDDDEIFEGLARDFSENQDAVNKEKIKRYWRKQLDYYSGSRLYKGKELRMNEGCTKNGDQIICSGENGDCATFGPYARLSAGDYVAKICFSIKNISTDEFFLIDICAGSGEKIILNSMGINKKNAKTEDGISFTSEVKFKLPQMFSDIELRTYICGSSNMFTLDSIEFIAVEENTVNDDRVAETTGGKIREMARKLLRPAHNAVAMSQALAPLPSQSNVVTPSPAPSPAPAPAPSPAPKSMRLSLVVACYNVGLYMERFLDSVFTQSSDLERFEVILVNDGSTDNTADIAQAWQARFPNHIRYIYQENGGVCAARNAGLAMATGTWVGFPDPDDFLSRDYFSAMLTETEVKHKLPLLAVISNFIFYHEDKDAMSDTHPLRYRFQNGLKRVRSGNMGQNLTLSTNNCWLHRLTLVEKEVVFDPKVKPSFEDAAMINSLLIAAPQRTVSFLPSPIYYYRKRSNQTSLLDNARSTSTWFIDQLEYGVLDLLKLTIDKLGEIPEHVQRTCLYDVFWRFRNLVNHSERADFLTDNEHARFHELMHEIFTYIDVNTITGFNLAGCTEEHKVALMGLYKGERRKKHSIYVEQLDSKTSMAQFSYFIGGDDDFNVNISVNGVSFDPILPSKMIADFMGKTYFRRRFFWVKLSEGDGVGFTVDDTPCIIKQRGNILGEEVNWRNLQNALTIATPNVKDASIRRLREYVKSSRNIYRGCYVLMDRDDKADDNAEHLYRHMMATGRADNAYFILMRDSLDWDRLEAEGFKLLPFGSDDHIAAQMNAAMLLSSHIDHYVFWPAEKHLFEDLARYQFVFLQHGMTTNDLSNWFNAKPIRLFITAMPEEADNIAAEKGKYIFSEREVLRSGFPRHDTLLSKAAKVEPDVILIMPTWRKYLTDETIRIGMQRGKVPEFLISDFARNWGAFLQDPRLQELAETHEKKVIFAPHPNMAMYMEDMNIPDWIEQIDVRQGISYQDLFARSSIAITDYSSTLMEIALLQRPVIYFQFDKESMFAGDHICKPGYFSYERDGFGPVAETPNKLIAFLKKALEGKEAQKYAKRRDKAFQFRDGNCCERVMQAVERLSDRPQAISPLYASAGKEVIIDQGQR